MGILVFVIMMAIMLIIAFIAIKNDTQAQKKKEEEAEKAPKKSTEQLLREAREQAAKVELLRQAKENNDKETEEKLLAGTFDGQLPIRLPNGEWLNYYEKLMVFDLAGVNYRKNIKKYVGENKVKLVPEPTNEFDENAIKIINSDNAHIGYVPQDLTDEVRAFVDLPVYGTAFITEKEDFDGEITYIGMVIIKPKK